MSDEDFSPTPTQDKIINSDESLMRVRAGAGTGKTFTMVRKIERLLQEGVPPEEILALTFTNNAADSIREKLVERTDLGGDANDVDVYTYHAIGETILRDNAYTADLDPQYEIATEVDQLQFVYQSLDDIPYRFMSPRVAEPDEWGNDVASDLNAFITELKGQGITPRDLRTYLGEPDRLIELGEVVDRLEEPVEELFDFGQWRKPTPERLSNDMIEPLKEYQNLLQAERSPLDTEGFEGDVRKYLKDLVDLCESLIEHFETRQDKIVDGPLKSTFKLPALLFNAKYSDGDPSGLPKIKQTPLDQLRDIVETCQQARDLTKGYAEYEDQLSDATMLDFADLVTRARNLYDDAGSDEASLDNWNYVFCDEFQDTDTIQFDLVAQLVGDDDLFVVGDEYQAIYEWRGANIENIRQRLDEQFNIADWKLGDNFRSSQPILEFANNALREHPAYETDSINDLKPGNHTQETNRGLATITPPEAKSNRKDIDSESEAKLITEAILQLLEGETELVAKEDLQRLVNDDEIERDAYRPGDIAILVRGSNHARPIIDELEAAGVPFTLGESIAAESVGVRTVIAYLKVMADPEREPSLNRVLTMRYRLCEADQRRLNEPDEPLSKTLRSRVFEEMDLVEPDKVREAADDLDYLYSIRDAHSLRGFYEALKERTAIESFLTESEREELTYLDEVVAEYGRENVQPGLSEEFIQFLQHHATTILEGSDNSQDQLEPDAGAINIMTIHKSKGLEFPVVVLPRLSRNSWNLQQRSNASIRHGIKEDSSPFSGDILRRDEFEQRRVFHVAVTRAQNLCILSGRASSNNDDDDDLEPETVAELLPPSMEWCTRANEFPIWEVVQTSLPESAVDWTSTLTENLDEKRDETIRTTNGETISLSAAYERLLSTAQAAIDGELDPVDPETLGLASEPIDAAPVNLLPKHSYTSISTFQRCQREHYLNNVVNSFKDPHSVSESTDSPLEQNYVIGNNQERRSDAKNLDSQAVGELFHRVAERADNRSYNSQTERKDSWQQYATNISGYDKPVREKVKNCIDVFFETRASRWTVLSTERYFDFFYDDHRIVGKIDAVCENENGEIYIVDYKTTKERKPEARQYQLPIYLYAATREDMLGDVEGSAYVYVNDQFSGAERVNDRRYKKDEVEMQMETIGATIDQLEESTYETAEATANTWCYGCHHRSLPCSNEFDEDQN